ncbi:unnamed protein product [Nippostrongylus brasiliensis]|uniref:DUF3475 domain-containing protein n=1 Tax=Nippostrongylus brasiliensis TaxID=27835 RepID=A0A0N4YC07_NIPBR|nr:unnamed protein product [Nippostrongylus brasiliensis]
MQCAYGVWYGFCDHVMVAFEKNEEAIRIMKDDRYSMDKKRLREIDHMLLDVLIKKEKAELLDLIIIALDKEVRELVHLQSRCITQRWEYECSVALIAVVQATIELVEAIEGIAEGSQLEVVKKAHDVYRDRFREGKHNILALCIQMATTIVDNIY